MSEVVIKVEGLSKKYRLGSVGTGTLRQDLHQWWSKIRGKGDPFEPLDFEGKINVENDEFWALKDLNFEVNQGDILGIIGKNGAGKSTLLKILSRVTSPTLGEIKIKGRIASLLEVGTGFHPELTGRENIFLNGAILGMTKKEIRRKLDEIIDFSGVERHIDTPVKRYSSGMYVRLAFAVAAHLEPEILIVDEVLAVGDAEFQKKCLGKMDQVAKQGRTVLFVSHNMTAVKKLCPKCILLQGGKMRFEGQTSEVIDKYLNFSLHQEKPEITWGISDKALPLVQITALRTIGINGKISSNWYIHEDFFIEVEFVNKKDGSLLSSYFEVRKNSEGGVFSSANWSSATANFDPFSNMPYPKGYYKSRMKVPGNYLNGGSYEINAWILENISATAAEAKDTLTIHIHDNDRMREEYIGEWFGVVRPKMEWYTSQLSG